MWFILSLLAAVLFAAMFLLARASRGIASGIVTASQSIWGPVLFLVTLRTTPYPWNEAWWQLYCILPFLVMPLIFWGLTTASQRTDVTVVKPLTSLSTISALLVGSTLFAESFSTQGIIGIVTITIGLLCLYHGRWHAWKEPWPWLGLGCVILLGVNATIVRAVLEAFPHPLALTAMQATGTFTVNGLLSTRQWSRTQWTTRTVLFLGIFSIITLISDLATITALGLAPAAYVMAIKRMSILLGAIGGYFIFHEKEQSLLRLSVACCMVIAGIVLVST